MRSIELVLRPGLPVKAYSTQANAKLRTAGALPVHTGTEAGWCIILQVHPDHWTLCLSIKETAVSSLESMCVAMVGHSSGAATLVPKGTTAHEKNRCIENL